MCDVLGAPRSTIDELRQAVAEFTRQYNTEWLIGRHGHLTPHLYQSGSVATVRTLPTRPTFPRIAFQLTAPDPMQPKNGNAPAAAASVPSANCHGMDR